MRFPGCCVALLAGLLLAPLVQAAPITFAFSGAVTDDPFGLTTFGAPISGTVTFNSAAPDSIPGAATGSYLSTGSPYGFLAIVDGTTYQVDGTSTINTANNIGADQYGVIAVLGSLELELFLSDSTQTALLSDALPLLPPLLSSFDVAQFRLFSNDAQFLGSLTSLSCTSGCSISAVAEPDTTLMIGISIIVLGWSRRRRVQRVCLPI